MKSISVNIKIFAAYFIVLIMASLSFVQSFIEGTYTVSSVIPLVIFGCILSCVFIFCKSENKKLIDPTTIFSMLVGYVILILVDFQGIKYIFADTNVLPSYRITLKPVFSLISKFSMGLVVAFAVICIIKLLKQRKSFSFNKLNLLYVLVPIATGFIDVAIEFLYMKYRIFISPLGGSSAVIALLNRFLPSGFFHNMLLFLFAGIVSFLFVRPCLSKKAGISLTAICILIGLLRGYVEVLANISMVSFSTNNFIITIVSAAFCAVGIRSLVQKALPNSN